MIITVLVLLLLIFLLFWCLVFAFTDAAVAGSIAGAIVRTTASAVQVLWLVAVAGSDVDATVLTLFLLVWRPLTLLQQCCFFISWAVADAIDVAASIDVAVAGTVSGTAAARPVLLLQNYPVSLLKSQGNLEGIGCKVINLKRLPHILYD